MALSEVLVKICLSDATAAKHLKIFADFFPRQKLEIFEIFEFALVQPDP